jgi:hypothetical protein
MPYHSNTGLTRVVKLQQRLVGNAAGPTAPWRKKEQKTLGKYEENTKRTRSEYEEKTKAYG